jgi:hypothetical protein
MLNYIFFAFQTFEVLKFLLMLGIQVWTRTLVEARDTHQDSILTFTFLRRFTIRISQLQTQSRDKGKCNQLYDHKFFTFSVANSTSVCQFIDLHFTGWHLYISRISKNPSKLLLWPAQTGEFTARVLIRFCIDLHHDIYRAEATKTYKYTALPIRLPSSRTLFDCTVNQRVATQRGCWQIIYMSWEDFSCWTSMKDT